MLRLLYLIWLCCSWTVYATSQTSGEIERLIHENRDNDTALSTIPVTGWVMSPTVRGTLDIVLTSVVTLLACIWSVLHLNIPADTGRYSAFLNKLPWVFIALLFPDTVIAVAIGEFLEAYSLRKALAQMRSEELERLAKVENLEDSNNSNNSNDSSSSNDSNDSNDSNNSNNVMPEYDLQFCFFVVMGGFQVSIEDIQPGQSCLGGYVCPKRVALSPSGFLELMKYRTEEKSELLNNPKLLEDRNKANIFQKIVIMTQITWMAAQCLVRKRQGLTIAILEIHVMAHVLCAVVIYIFWFKKPMDISQPEVLELQSTKMKGFLALVIQSQWCPDALTKALVFSNGTTNTIQPSPDGNVSLCAGQALACGVRYKPSQGLQEELVLLSSDVERIERAASYITDIRESQTDVQESQTDVQESQTDVQESQNDEVAVFPRVGYLGMCMQSGSNIPSPHVPREYKWLRIPVALSGTWMGDPDNRNHEQFERRTERRIRLSLCNMPTLQGEVARFGSPKVRQE
ncbi:hypothetical protein CcaCcLH18_11267 [Colletotrichum camelliae]|nr:hypothetical protein CcaCcLH18_11267 [Colletotrichum camelliae]